MSRHPYDGHHICQQQHHPGISVSRGPLKSPNLDHSQLALFSVGHQAVKTCLGPSQGVQTYEHVCWRRLESEPRRRCSGEPTVEPRAHVLVPLLAHLGSDDKDIFFAWLKPISTDKLDTYKLDKRVLNHRVSPARGVQPFYKLRNVALGKFEPEFI